MVFRTGNKYHPRRQDPLMPIGERVIATCKCQHPGCEYERTIDSARFPDLEKPVRKVKESARWHARQHHHDVLVTTTYLSLLKGSLIDGDPPATKF